MQYHVAPCMGKGVGHRHVCQISHVYQEDPVTDMFVNICLVWACTVPPGLLAMLATTQRVSHVCNSPSNMPQQSVSIMHENKI